MPRSKTNVLESKLASAGISSNWSYWDQAISVQTGHGLDIGPLLLDIVLNGVGPVWIWLALVWVLCGVRVSGLAFVRSVGGSKLSGLVILSGLMVAGARLPHTALRQLGKRACSWIGLPLDCLGGAKKKTCGSEAPH